MGNGLRPIIPADDSKILVVRCFVALRPSPAVADVLAAAQRPPFPGLRWSEPGQWHVTLRFLGELEEQEPPLAVEALRAVTEHWPGPVMAHGGPSTRLLGPGLVVWPVEGLAQLARAVVEATADLGRAPEDRPFFGHVTMARARRGTDLRPARHLLTPLAAEWEVRSLSLVESELHPDGARYRDIIELPLASPGPPS